MSHPKENLQQRVIHVNLPVAIWKKFMHWCIDEGHSSLTAGIKDLIKQSVK